MERSQRNDVLDPDVRLALSELRRRGIIVILVSGRILDDLRRICGDLHFLDAAVAENGASIEFPATGYTMTLGPAPSEVCSMNSGRPALNTPREAPLWKPRPLTAPEYLQSCKDSSSL